MFTEDYFLTLLKDLHTCISIYNVKFAYLAFSLKSKSKQAIKNTKVNLTSHFNKKMKITKLPHLSSSHKIQLLELWNNEYPEKLNYNSLDDFENYLDQLTEQSHFLLIAENNQIKGWYFDFKRMDEKWFVILLASEIQGKGFGTKLLHLAKEKEAELNAWVIDRNTEKKKDGSFYKSPLSFYQKNKFEVLSEIRLELDILSAVKIQWKNRI